MTDNSYVCWLGDTVEGLFIEYEGDEYEVISNDGHVIRLENSEGDCVCTCEYNKLVTIIK